MKQVTSISFSLHTYVGETRSLQHNGEVVAVNAGTGYLAVADAATSGETNLKSSTTKASKPAPTTSTTVGGGVAN